MYGPQGFVCFRVFAFGVSGLGFFRVLWVQGLGRKILIFLNWGLDFWVYGLGFLQVKL